MKIVKITIAVLSVALVCLVASCETIRYDRSFCGKIIDKETNESIPGVVVIGDWENVSPGPGGATHTVYKVAEVITDNAGEFCLKGQGFVFFVDEPSIEIFKSGYSNIIDPYFPNLKNPLHHKNDDISWNGNKAIIRLKKLSIEERSERYSGVSKFDTYIDQGILSAPNYGVKSNDAVKSGRKAFDTEIKKEIDEVKQYRDKINPPKNDYRPLTIIPMNQ